MLMTVLKGDLATRQSKSLIRLFKRMKDYLSDSHGQIGRQEILSLAMQTQKNTDSICNIEKQLQNTATKDDLANFMQNFMDVATGKEYLFMEWKMGNYIYGGMEPDHYVFMRER